MIIQWKLQGNVVILINSPPPPKKKKLIMNDQHIVIHDVIQINRNTSCEYDFVRQARQSDLD